MLACGTVLGGVAYAFGLDWRAATIVGLGLALSSTALVMREIDEGGERRTPFGETAIAVLLFEDPGDRAAPAARHADRTCGETR